MEPSKRLLSGSRASPVSGGPIGVTAAWVNEAEAAAPAALDGAEEEESP